MRKKTSKFVLPGDGTFEPSRSVPVRTRKRKLAARDHESTSDFMDRVILNLGRMADEVVGGQFDLRAKSVVHWDPKTPRRCELVVEAHRHSTRPKEDT